MAKAKRYKIICHGRSIEISNATSSTLIYRIPYQNLSSKDELITIDNSFIVYILVGANDNGLDYIYVGKSKNGLKHRPTSHEDKCDSWTYCYVLTQFKERTFFNDGAIQYIEDKLNRLVTELGSFTNTTMQTTTGTANQDDDDNCDEYLEQAYQMLDVLGLDLITHKADAGDSDTVTASDLLESDTVPDGEYDLKRKIKRSGGKIIHAKMKVSDGKFIVLKGSMICMVEGPGLLDNVLLKRNNADISADGILLEDVVFNSPSAAGSFVIAASCNGWLNWKCTDGSLIDKYRKKDR